MNKLLIEVYLPAAQKSFDLLIPADMKVSQLTKLAAQALSQLSGALYAADDDSLLCDRESGRILDINMTAWNLGLRNGSRLMLI